MLVAGKPIEDVSPLEWEWILGVNLYGTINGIQTFCRASQTRWGTHIVNTSSIGGFEVNPSGAPDRTT